MKQGTYNSIGQKWCNKGKHYEDLNNFGTNNQSNDGKNWVCRECIKGMRIRSSEELILLKERNKRILLGLNFPSNSVVPKIEWSKLLQTKLVSKPNYINQHTL